MTRCDTPEAKELFVAIHNAIRQYQVASGNEVLTININDAALDTIAIKMNPSCEVQPIYYDGAELA